MKIKITVEDSEQAYNVTANSIDNAIMELGSIERKMQREWERENGFLKDYDDQNVEDEDFKRMSENYESQREQDQN
jgi:hypothetical protein